MRERSIQVKIEEIGRQIRYGPGESNRLRIIRVATTEGISLKATVWGAKSDEIRIGSNVSILKMPINPLSKVEDYEVINSE